MVGISTVQLGGVGFFDLKEAGGIFVKESGSSGADFTRSGPNFTSRRSSQWLSVAGCWKAEILVPWKEVVAVVAEVLWSMLSMTAVVNLFSEQVGRRYWVKMSKDKMSKD